MGPLEYHAFSALMLDVVSTFLRTRSVFITMLACCWLQLCTPELLPALRLVGVRPLSALETINAIQAMYEDRMQACTLTLVSHKRHLRYMGWLLQQARTAQAAGAPDDQVATAAKTFPVAVSSVDASPALCFRPLSAVRLPLPQELSDVQAGLQQALGLSFLHPSLVRYQSQCQTPCACSPVLRLLRAPGTTGRLHEAPTHILPITFIVIFNQDKDVREVLKGLGMKKPDPGALLSSLATAYTARPPSLSDQQLHLRYIQASKDKLSGEGHRKLLQALPLLTDSTAGSGGGGESGAVRAAAGTVHFPLEPEWSDVQQQLDAAGVHFVHPQVSFCNVLSCMPWVVAELHGLRLAARLCRDVTCAPLLRA